MCFTASGSFIAGAGLAVVAAINLSNSGKASEKMFAAIPLLFSVQQILEGFVWLSFQHSYFNGFRMYGAYGFMFFAQILWPLWVPLSFLHMEEKHPNRNILKVLSFLGLLVSISFACAIWKYPLEVRAESYHIDYKVVYQNRGFPLNNLFYLLVILLPPFISGYRQMRKLGTATLMTLCATLLFFKAFLISVWCFFAAIISVLTWSIIKSIQNERIVGSPASQMMKED